MVEIHGWITVRETFEATDEDNVEDIIVQLGIEIDKLNNCNTKMKRLNGECFIEFLSCTNHMSSDVNKLLAFLRK